MNNDLPKLKASKKDILKATKKITNNTGDLIAEAGEIFIVKDIVGYGFDLESKKEPKIEVRIMNSDLLDHFSKTEQ